MDTDTMRGKVYAAMMRAMITMDMKTAQDHVINTILDHLIAEADKPDSITTDGGGFNVDCSLSTAIWLERFKGENQ